ncbi:hypothetical protein [Streptomyces sp. H39-S7]|uniref:hypothetical protein n=1 Tax=Streptomyces sp. H39-S7 TaxID=3004357 RepID=UPI0022AF9A88|nr:hypothetical protein [Streptomyces sp. H39-S7]MCZ4124343.1 hypothetical protein [Streptomyces sp. H39-S7]
MDSVPSGERTAEPVAFSYNQERISVIRAIVSNAHNAATNYREIASIIFQEEGQEDPAIQAEIREVAATFYYRLRLQRGPGSKPGATLEPLSETGDSHYFPRPIKAVGPEVLKLWGELLSENIEPEIQGLLADLLFSARHPKPHIHARRAVEAYVAAQDGNFGQLDKSAMLVRAWSILRSLGLKDLELSVETAMMGLVESTLKADVSAPGTVLPILRCLLEGRLRAKKEAKRAEIPAKAIDYLFSALDLYKTDHLSMQLAYMARDCLNDKALTDLALRKAAANLLEAAEQETNGHLKAHWLEQAAKFARRFHLDDIQSECVRQLQAVDPATFQWMTIRAGGVSPVRPSDIESYLQIFDQPHLISALIQFFNTPSPTGSRKVNEKIAKNVISNSLTHKIMGMSTYGAHGLPQKSYSTDNEKLQYEINGVEVIGMARQGNILSAALGRMAETHVIPQTGDLAAWFVEEYGSDPGLCMSLAESLSLFWGGNYVSCAQLAMPRIEAAIRSLLLLLNEPIYRVEEDKSLGQFPGLGTMLPLLDKHGFDPDWSSFIRALLLTPGRNLRNLGAHGFLQDVDKQTAALVIRALSLVALLAPEETSKKACDHEAIRESLAFPTGGNRLTFSDRLLLKVSSRLNAILSVRSGRS